MIRPVSAQVTPQRMSSSLPAAAPKVEVDGVQLSTARFSLRESLAATQAVALSLASKLKDGEYVPGEVLVKLASGVAPTSVDGFAQDYGAKAFRFDVPPSIQEQLGGELLKLQLPAGLSTPEALAAMSRDPRVAACDSNDIIRLPEGERTQDPPPAQQPAPPAEPPAQPEPPPPPPFTPPNDLHGDLWGLQNTGQTVNNLQGQAGVDCKVMAAWHTTTGSRTGPIIAVIDSGVDGMHPDLANNMWRNPGEVGGDNVDNDGNGVVDDVYGYSGINGSGAPVDENGHGTHCAGTIGAQGNNGVGVVGVNWEAQLMALRFLGPGGAGTTEDAIKCVLYATRMGARITSNSWSGDKYNAILFDALRSSPAMHICAAGNEGYDNDVKPVYPASYQLDNVISVAAHDNKDRLAKFSNRGEKSVHLAAPGVDIYSTKPGNAYALMSGTSMATPHVAGVAGLIATHWPEASNDDIRRRLLHGVDRMPEPFSDRMVTGGRLNAEKAMEADSTAPGTIEDLRSSAVGPTSLDLRWTATGDDGAVGQAVDYELRYSDAPIVMAPDGSRREVAFQDATRVDAPHPGPAGSPEAIKVNLSPSGKRRDLHFALRALDNVGNASELANATVSIPAVPVAFEDGMEDGKAKWTAEGRWAQVAEPGHGHVWTDSPDGDYAHKTNASLTSTDISLKDYKSPKLYFDAKHDIELKHDGLQVEVYGKKGWFGGTKWRTEKTLDGISNWQTHVLDLSEYEGQDVKVRFRMESDDSRARDGAYLDNVVVTGAKGS